MKWQKVERNIMSKTYKDSRDHKTRKKDNFDSFFNRKKKMLKRTKGGKQYERMDRVSRRDFPEY